VGSAKDVAAIAARDMATSIRFIDTSGTVVHA
jgi:hypothetical protein